MADLKIDFVRDLLQRFNNKEMSIGKVVELLNEEAKREVTAEEAGIFYRKECCFKYCPSPELCQEKCISGY